MRNTSSLHVSAPRVAEYRIPAIIWIILFILFTLAFVTFRLKNPKSDGYDYT